MKRRILCLLVVLFIIVPSILVMSPCGSKQVITGFNVYIDGIVYSNDNNFIEITYGETTWKNKLSVKLQYKNKTEKDDIAEGAFADCTNLTIIIPISVTNIAHNAITGDSSNTIIYCETSAKPTGWYYQNAASQWYSYNSGGPYWYSETEPTSGINFWHYVNGVPTIWVIE